MARADVGEEVWTSDPYGRNFAGMPPAKSGDYAWVQHMLMSMAAKTGRMAVVVPHGALFRAGAEKKIRGALLATDILDAVIGLGPNLFYGTGLAACILVFRQTKPKAHRKKVLIVDASTRRTDWTQAGTWLWVALFVAILISSLVMLARARRMRAAA